MFEESMGHQNMWVFLGYWDDRMVFEPSNDLTLLMKSILINYGFDIEDVNYVGVKHSDTHLVLHIYSKRTNVIKNYKSELNSDVNVLYDTLQNVWDEYINQNLTYELNLNDTINVYDPKTNKRKIPQELSKETCGELLEVQIVKKVW